MLVSSHAFHATLPAPFIPAAWQQVADSSFGISSVNAVTSGLGTEYVAVGDAGKIGYSNTSAVTWSQVSSPFQGTNLYSVHYANNLYVAGGSTGKLATSTDGLTWTLRNSGFGASPILGITYFSTFQRWIIVGGSGKLATSSDGISWVLRTSSFNFSFINSVYSNSSKAIAVGYDGKLATSTNGIDWTQKTSSFVFDTIYDVVSNSDENEYVAVGDLGKIATSSNGENWTQLFPGSTFGSSSVRTVARNNITYAAGGSLGKIATSFNGIGWVQRSSNFEAETVNDLSLTSAGAVAVGNGGKIAYSFQEFYVQLLNS